MTATEDWVALLDDQLLELAAGDENSIGFLALAEEYRNADDLTAPQVSAVALRKLTGTPGQRLGAWHELAEAVEQYHRWDLEADSKGYTPGELGIPSRERVLDNAEYALRSIRGRVAA